MSFSNLETEFFGPLSDEEKAAFQEGEDRFSAQFRADNAARVAREQHAQRINRRLQVALLATSIFAWSLYGYSEYREDRVNKETLGEVLDDRLGCSSLAAGTAVPDGFEFPEGSREADISTRRAASAVITHCEETWGIEPTRRSVRDAIRDSIAADIADIPEILVKDSEWSECKAAGCGSKIM